MTTRTTRVRAVRASFAVATALLVTGCSVSEAEAPSADATAPPSAPPASNAPATPGASASGTSSSGSSGGPSSSPPASAPPATGAPSEALAGRDFTVTGTYTRTPLRLRLDVQRLQRRGELLDLTATLTNLERDGSRDLRWQVGSRFQGPFREDLASTDGSFSGAVLTDVTGKKRYLVAADTGEMCVCTVQLSSTLVGAGQSVELNATYAAPPPSTTQLDVAIPSLGTFRDLPVS